MQQSTKIISLVSFMILSIFSFQKTFAQSETINPKSYITDMGSQAPIVSNSIKPFGLVDDLLKNYCVPVNHFIKSGKVKVGVDLSLNKKNDRGCPFIITA